MNEAVHVAALTTDEGTGASGFPPEVQDEFDRQAAKNEAVRRAAEAELAGLAGTVDLWLLQLQLRNAAGVHLDLGYDFAHSMVVGASSEREARLIAAAATKDEGRPEYWLDPECSTAERIGLSRGVILKAEYNG